MELHTRLENNVTVVAASGRLDAVTTPAFEEHIRALVAGGVSSFVLDLERLQYISSAGLRGILTMAQLVKEKQGRVILAGVTGNVRSVFDMCRISELFRLEDSVEAAVAAAA